MKHTNHDHPNTTAGRTACRKATTFALAAIPPACAAAGSYPQLANPTRTYIKGTHCQSCGSTAWDDIMTGNDEDLQGYTRCCNERSVIGHLGECNDDNCYHS
jgi:hypothetical protein